MRMEWPRQDLPGTVGPVAVQAGRLTRGTLRAGLADIPLLVLGGGAPGPVLYVQALQHGLELNGVEVMRRLVTTLEPSRLRGTLILVPMANTLAARVHMQSYPYADRPRERQLNDMNRRWREPLGGANHVDQAVAALAPCVAMADAMIDLHCHEYLYAPMALTDCHDPTSRALGIAMGLGVVNHSLGTEGMFGRYCRDTLGKPAITVEMPPLRRVDAGTSAMGFRAVLNALRWMGMLDEPLDLPERALIFDGGVSDGVRAEHEGFVARLAQPGDLVTAGAVVGEIWSPDRFEPVQVIRAPRHTAVTSLGRPPVLWGDPEQDFVNVGESVAGFCVPAAVVEPRRELA